MKKPDDDDDDDRRGGSHPAQPSPASQPSRGEKKEIDLDCISFASFFPLRRKNLKVSKVYIYIATTRACHPGPDHKTPSLPTARRGICDLKRGQGEKCRLKVLKDCNQSVCPPPPLSRGRRPLPQLSPFTPDLSVDPLPLSLPRNSLHIWRWSWQACHTARRSVHCS